MTSMSVLSLPDAKLHLNITSSTNDTELQAFIDAAEAVIVNRVGPLSPTSVTSRVQGGTGAIILPVVPVISLTSVTPVYTSASALDLTNLTVSRYGILSYFGSWGYFSYTAYDVTYVAGRTTVPTDLMLAVKELTRHLWNNSQRGAGASLRGGSDDTQSVAPWLLPNEVTELINPYTQVGVA